ncbi:cupin domain-containing protein [Spirosoma harenae]
MKHPLLLSLIFISLVSTKLFAQHVHPATSGATPPTYATILQQAFTEQDLANREVKMLIVDYPPNSASAPHRHPCPTFGYILEGEIESTFEGKTRQYKKGDTFYEFANGLHSSAKNNHPTQPAKLLVFFLAEKGKPTSIPEK